MEALAAPKEHERLFPQPSAPAVEQGSNEAPRPISGTDAGGAVIIVKVSLEVDNTGRARTWVEDDPPGTLPAKVDAASFAGVAASVKKRGATQVLISVDERTKYNQVVGLIDALHTVGISQVAIQLVQAAAPQNAAKP